MKNLRLTSVLGIMILLLALAPAAYAGGPSGDWVSGITCQNLEGVDSTVLKLVFYPEGSSTPALDYDDPIQVTANGSRNYYTPSSPAGVPDPFIGAVVVNSDVSLHCTINTQTSGTGTELDPYRIATSAGFSDDGDGIIEQGEQAPTMYAPQVMKNLAGTWSSYMAVQNTEDSKDVAVTVTYKDRFGSSIPAATETATIKANSNKLFYQTDNPNLPDGFLGAATISADDDSSKLAVTVNFYNNNASYSSAQFHSYSGFGAGAKKLIAPRVVRKFAAYNSGVTIQNIGPNPTNVKITFNFAGNSYEYTTPSPIAQNASLPLYLPDVTELTPVDSLPENQRFGNAVIEALAGDGLIVAIINEDNRGGIGVPTERIGQGSTYNAVPDGSQTNTAFFTQIANKAGVVFSGGFQVSNTTANPGTCDISYNNDTDANESGVALSANGSISKYAPNVLNLNVGYNASVTVVCTQPIVGIYNLAAEPGSGKFGDSFMQGNGLNR